MNHLPDAVLMVSQKDNVKPKANESVLKNLHDDYAYLNATVPTFTLHQCNKQADDLFNANLSQAMTSDVSASQYLMLK